MRNEDDPVYYEPRDLFDEAIIRTNENNRIEYDQEKLKGILTKQYLETIDSMSNYRNATESDKQRRAERLACKWLITMRDAAIFGSLTKRPLIVKK